ncbi:golgin IMH1 isoform X2 [Drosophila eugracilis]|uniref:golgin IMH1 isoform X2 n=1 Tax=Drosophila eugracilis TaxID=29029 RepID=UPI0007E7804F|nr:golgin IMH1 isoform X2 [Drosophila eugracilis]
MADQLNIEGRIQKAVANGKDKNDENNAYATKPDDKQVLPQSLEKFVDLKSQRSTEVELKEWTTTEKMDRSLDLDIYDDLDEIKSQGSTKIVEKERSLDLDIYDDLDDFQKAEDHKTKELLAWEVKYEKAQAEIQDLKIENKALGKKIKTMEVNLQNLLDTAKAEVKRKEALIAQLRKEKDDLCFRRKRGREVDEKGEKGQESKRIKECQSNAQKNSETDRNPFKTASKNDTRKANFKNDEKMTKTREDTKKSIIRTNYPELGQPKTNEQRSSTHNHYSGKGHRSRDRRHSRSRSPKHSSRLDTRSSKCSARQVKRGSRSQSPSI